MRLRQGSVGGLGFIAAERASVICCGCANHDARSANALYLTGQRYRRLTVLGLDPVPYVSPSGKNRARKEAEAEYYAPIIEAYNAEKE